MRRTFSPLGFLITLVLLLPVSCSPASEPGGVNPASVYVGSNTCRECHEEFYELWAHSRHGLAMQPFTLNLGKTELEFPDHDVQTGSGVYRIVLGEDGGKVIDVATDAQANYPIEYALGGKNVYYFLTLLERGRIQVLPVAWDVNAREWFDAAASAIRHFPDITDEALDWRHPAYTFNTSCYGCHVSQISTNFELATQTYRSTWTEPGINCETCHGPAEEHVRVCREASPGEIPVDLKIVLTKQFDVEQTNDLCVPCHAKARPLSARYAPGESFYDHFDLVTAENLDYYPDGRDLGENYTQTSWLMSPCARSGKLDCLHCHTSSGRFRQKNAPDTACLPCHEDRVSDPDGHTRHGAARPAVRCIDCHMPATWFARMARHDHSMRPPMPAATLAFESPNACNICHSKQSAEWANSWVDTWHGPGSQRDDLEVATLVDAARRQDWSRLDEMLAYVTGTQRDEVMANSLIRLLRSCTDDRKWSALLSAVEDPSPLVRSSAAEALGDGLDSESLQALVTATGDAFRLVRIRAAAALAQAPPGAIDPSAADSVAQATNEFVVSMQARPDDAYSHYNLGNFYLNVGDAERAIRSFETAVQLRPDLVQPLVNLANVYASLGRMSDAEQALRSALELQPDDAVAHFNLGLALGEQGRLEEAARSHRAALKADPELAAAAYNLGVILAREDPDEGLRWSRKAADLRPDQPRYAYTVAFFLQERGSTSEAIAILENLTSEHPGYAEAWVALGSTYEQEGRIDEARRLYTRASDNSALPFPLRQQFADKSRR